jgi:hypothetical protein
MFGYRLPGNIEVLGDGVGGHGVHGDQDEDRASGGVCNGLKNVSSHGNLDKKPFGCKYTRSRSVSQNLFLSKIEWIADQRVSNKRKQQSPFRPCFSWA